MKLKVKAHDLLSINECIVTDDEDNEIGIFRDGGLMTSLIELAELYGHYRFNEHGVSIGYIPDDRIKQEFLKEITVKGISYSKKNYSLYS